MSPKVEYYHRVALERLDAYNKSKGAVEYAMWKVSVRRLSRELHKEATLARKESTQWKAR